MCRFCEQSAFGHEEPYDPQLGRRGFVPGTNMAPDLILHGGTILTMDPLQPVAEAVSIREGVIQAVGDAETVLASRGRMTRVTGLGGKTLLPGMVVSLPSLPEACDRLSLDRWVSHLVQAGVTTLHLADLGASRADYDAFHDLLMRRHRVRLRGAIGPTLHAGWGEPLVAGSGHDLIRLDALNEPLSQGVENALEAAQRHHEAGWSVVLIDDMPPDGCVLRDLAEALRGRKVAGIRLSADGLSADLAQTLTEAGLDILPAGDTVVRTPWTRGDAETRTRVAARLAGVGDICGMLCPGRYADFTFLDCEPAGGESARPRVLGTWIEGVPVRQETDYVAI